MVYKPRTSKLSPYQARTLEARRQRRREKRLGRELAGHAFSLFETLHLGVQVAAETNPVYRPLVGSNGYETLGLFGDYVRALMEADKANGTDAVTRVFKDVGMLDEDARAPLLGMVLAVAAEPALGPPQGNNL